jgi:ABC-type multidrug transport system permease subunit
MNKLARSSLWQLSLWRFREFAREPEAMFWVFAFPLLLAFALGLAFKSRGVEVVHVAVADGSGAADITEILDASERVEATLLPGDSAHHRLRTGRVAVVVRPGDPVVLQFDSTRSESEVARLVVENALQDAAGRRDVREIRDQPVMEPGSRYIDFLLPGLLGLNIMGTGMWSVGFGIVKSRQDKLLKRFLASPMRKSEYMLSYILARLVFLALEVAALVLFGYWVLDVPMRGSVFALGAIALIGAMAFSGLGLLVASRVKTIEGVSGLMNLVMVPMWIGSGVFFAYSNFPDFLQPFLRALPLTALNDALRAVMLDGAGFVATLGFLGVIALWGLASFGTAVKIFRWQ